MFKLPSSFYAALMEVKQFIWVLIAYNKCLGMLIGYLDCLALLWGASLCPAHDNYLPIQLIVEQ